MEFHDVEWYMKFLAKNQFNAIRLLFNHKAVIDGSYADPGWPNAYPVTRAGKNSYLQMFLSIAKIAARHGLLARFAFWVGRASEAGARPLVSACARGEGQSSGARVSACSPRHPQHTAGVHHRAPNSVVVRLVATRPLQAHHTTAAHSQQAPARIFARCCLLPRLRAKLTP
eukprot:3977309-Prymnesium_polylepis.1